MWRPKSIDSKFKEADTGRISPEEYRQMIEHVEHCASCKSAHTDFLSSLKPSMEAEYGRARGEIIRHLEKGGVRERFFERARAASIQFSDGIASGDAQNSNFLHSYRWAMAAGLLTMITIAVGQSVWRQGPKQTQEAGIQIQNPGIPAVQDQDIQNLKKKFSELQTTTDSSKREISELRAENSKMLSEITTMGQDLAGGRTENQALQQALARLREQNAQASIENENNAQLLAHAQTELDEARSRGKALEAESASQKAEVGALSQQVAAKTATISHDRELLAAGRDITDLMGARNLHIIDVRDADGKGKNKKSFGRIFYTEGKSLIFYAYDLDQEKATNADYSFEVWGERLGEPASVRSLGILFTDDKDQKRWAFEVDDPQLLAEIDSVFVTLEPHQGDSQPRGGRILFAYLGGRANHP